MLGSTLSHAASRLTPAAQVRKGDFIYVSAVPYARPTELTVGWHQVLEVMKARPRDVVSFRVLPFSMSERNDVLSFNKKELVSVRL